MIRAGALIVLMGASGFTVPTRYQNHCWASWFCPFTVQLNMPAELLGSIWTTELPSVRVTTAALWKTGRLKASAPEMSHKEKVLWTRSFIGLFIKYVFGF